MSLNDGSPLNKAYQEIDNLREELRETKCKLADIDNLRQELHETKRKLEASLALQHELADSNEALEQLVARENAAFAKKMHDYEEKKAHDKKEYEERLAEMEIEMEKLAREARENEKSRQLITKVVDSSETSTDDLESLKEEISILNEKIHDLTNALKEQEVDAISRHREMEMTVKALQEQLEEVNNILKVKKEELTSTKEMLENTRDELILCRGELDLLKVTPASDSAKGNSLFAEVEDRRQKMLQNMTNLRTNYEHMKRTYGAKEAEIRALKAERAALLRKWEDDTIEKVAQDTRLIETYKSRISELEMKLKDEQRKTKQAQSEVQQPNDNSFSYLQLSLNAKKKEVENLQMQLEDYSIRRVLEEGMKHDMAKQLRQWRYKAMSMQAQLLAMNCQLQSDGYIPKLESQPPETDIETDDQFERRLQEFVSSKPTSSASPTDDESLDTLEKLIQAPKKQIKQYKDTADLDIVKQYYNPEIQIQDLNKPEKYIDFSVDYLPINEKEAIFSIQSEGLKPLSKKDALVVEDRSDLSPLSTSKEKTITLDSSENDMSLTCIYETAPLGREPEKNPENRQVETSIPSTSESENDMSFTCMYETAPLRREPEKIPENRQVETSIPSTSEIGTIKSKKGCTTSVSNIGNPILKSALTKSERKLSYGDDKDEKEKKSLRFAADTVDPQGNTLIRHKEPKKKYPIVFISNKSNK